MGGNILLTGGVVKLIVVKSKEQVTMGISIEPNVSQTLLI
jgi:hypothetical protein